MHGSLSKGSVARVKQPCEKDCPERSPECHGKCERYKAFQAERMRQYELNAQKAIVNEPSKWRMDNYYRAAIDRKKGLRHSGTGGT